MGVLVQGVHVLGGGAFWEVEFSSDSGVDMTQTYTDYLLVYFC